MHLSDFNSRFPNRSLAVHAARCPSSLGDKTPPAKGLALSPVAVARVDHGRWIADCPTRGCGGAEFVSLTDPVFFCCECRNAPTRHVPIRVVVPDVEMLALVDSYLGARPAAATRNWSPDEPVAELQAENREHGITPEPRRHP